VAQSLAALPPHYSRWHEFGAIVEERTIPSKLGPTNAAERIERVGHGRYRVHGGGCYVEVSLDYHAPPTRDGHRVFGSGTVSVAQVSERRCQ
jgi:hypothetical protein